VIRLNDSLEKQFFFVFGMVQCEPWYEKFLSFVISPLNSENTAFLIQKTIKYKIKNGQEIVKK